MSVDLHTGQIQGFSSRPFDHLTARPVFIDYLVQAIKEPITVVSPDSGRVKLASKYGRRLDADVAFVNKRRSPEEHNQASALEVVGKVRDRHAVIVDDIIDTAGTMAAAAELLRERGATGVSAVATHGVFSVPSLDRIKNAPIEEVVITNTLPLPADVVGLEQVTVLSIAPIIAEALKAIFSDESVSRLFLEDNQ